MCAPFSVTFAEGGFGAKKHRYFVCNVLFCKEYCFEIKFDGRSKNIKYGGRDVIDVSRFSPLLHGDHDLHP